MQLGDPQITLPSRTFWQKKTIFAVFTHTKNLGPQSWRLRVAVRKNSKQNKMEEADSGQPKAKKKKTKKGNEKRWWYQKYSSI